MTKTRRAENLAMTPHASEVGSRVCLGCLGASHRTKFGAVKFKPFPHTFVEGACQFKAPGERRIPKLEPGEQDYLDRQRAYDARVPF